MCTTIFLSDSRHLRKTDTARAVPLTLETDIALVKRIPVKYFIIIPICLLIAICNFIVAKTLNDSIADSKLEIFTEKNITNIRAIIPTLALSIWEFNVDRVASTLSGIDDGKTFLFAAVSADEMEFSFRGNRKAYENSLYSLCLLYTSDAADE